MGTISDHAICLRHWDFSETSQTVLFFTAEHGLLRGLAKGSKRRNSRFSGGIDVLTRGQVVAIIKPGKDLAIITEWYLEEVYRSIRVHLHANRAAMYMADMVLHMLTDHDPHPDLYRAMRDSLASLGTEDSPQHVLLLFQWRLLGATGYRPQLDHDVETGAPLPEDARTLAFSPGAGGVVVDRDSNDRWRVRRSTIELLRTLDEPALDPDVPGESIHRASSLLAMYCREIVGRPLPSLSWSFPDLDTRSPRENHALSRPPARRQDRACR